MVHVFGSFGAQSVGFVADEGNNHAVEVEEEHDQVETKLNEGFLFMHVQFPEDFCRIQ